MSNLPKLPDLGMFFGDAGGGPNLALPQSESFPTCPFIDKQSGEFCALDGNMCPFVGFNYRRCKKYLNNMAKGMSNQSATGNPVPMGSNQPPRVSGSTSPQRHPRIESLFEAAKKRGSKDPGREAKKVIHKQRTARQKALDKKTQAEMAELLADDPGLMAEIKKLHQTLQAASSESDAAAQNMSHLVKSNGVFKGLLDQTKKRRGDRDTEAALDAMANMYAGFLRHHLNAKIPDGRIGALHDFSRNIFLYAAVDHGDQSYNPHDAAAARAAREAAETHGDKGSVGMEGEPGRPSGKPKGATKKSTTKTKPTVAAKEKVKKATKGGRFTIKSRTLNRRFGPKPQGSAPAPNIPLSVGAPPPKPKEKAAKKKGTTGPRFGMTTPSRMNTEQFEAFMNQRVESLSVADQQRVFAGVSRGGLNAAIADAKKIAVGLGKSKNYNEIAKFAKYFEDRVGDVKKTRDAEADLKANWASNLRKIKSLPLGDRKAYEMAVRKAHQPKQQDLMAKIMNKTINAAYTLETKNIKIGTSEVTTFIRKATFPTFNRGDYEVMRMAEQAGLKAIQKQHQYGLGYGKWSTWVTFFKDLLAPFVLWYTGHADYIRPLMALPLQKFADQLYMSYIQSPLPKFKGRSGLQMSRDSKFEMSQKANSGSRERIMHGWEKDDILPPDQAVLHKRWYPTTKKTWGKTRTKELTKRWQASKAAPQSDDWTRGYL